MDWEAFESDVQDSIMNGLHSDMESDMESGGCCFTIGETWQGTLYGHEQNNYGQTATHRFDTEEEQRQWFDAVTADMGGSHNW